MGLSGFQNSEIYSLDLESTAFERSIQYDFTFTADKFDYCSILNNATFDGSAFIYSLGGSVFQQNPDSSWFYNLIDYRAAQVEKAIVLQHSFVSKDDAKRYACYSTAIGNYPFVNISQERLLISIDPVTFFQPIFPAINIDIDGGSKKKFKLAYLIMVHELNGFLNLEKLLDFLDDGDAIILVHVDSRSSCTQLYNKIKDWIENTRKKRDTNVNLAKYRLHNIWGHSSLVFTQLSGFWELLELADWDFVINLSNYDWPLRNNSQIHSSLQLGKNYISLWHQNGIVIYK